jgi:hypothetical protein
LEIFPEKRLYANFRLNWAVGRRSLRISIPVAGPCGVRIFSLTGQCETSLELRDVAAGTSLVNLPADLGAGCYLVDLQSPTMKPLRKLILVK